MALRLWCPLLGLFLAAELAASIAIPSARARVPRGAQDQPGPTTNESIWIVGGPGQSCTAACGAYAHAESAACNEDMIKYLDTEAEVSNIAVDGNIPCDPSLGFGWSEFPQITTWNQRCSYRRPWQYPDSCHVVPNPASHRYCSCGGTWFRGALGDSCDATCAGRGVCDELPLEECITEECIKALGVQFGFPCSSAIIYAKEFPSQLPNNDCAYTYGYQERCDESASPTVQRFCACDAINLEDGYGSGDPHITSIYGEKFDINLVGTHSMIRIPEDGRGAGKTLELNARVADFGRQRKIYRCHPYYFDMIDLRGELLGGAVRHIEVRRGRVAGVSFSGVMAEGNQSLLDQDLTASATLRKAAVFGNVTVRHTTRQRKGFRARHSLALRIQADPPIEVTVFWWNDKPYQPGLNLRVHGLSPGLGTIGGLMGRDPHGNVSSGPAIRGCPPEARADGRQTVASTAANRRGGEQLLVGGGLYPDVVIQ